MATLHVRNVPDEVYEGLRGRASARGRSINAEAVRLLSDAFGNRPRETLAETLSRAAAMRARTSRTPGAPTVVEMIRADRDR